MPTPQGREHDRRTANLQSGAQPTHKAPDATANPELNAAGFRDTETKRRKRGGKKEEKNRANTYSAHKLAGHDVPTNM